jgi:hypothetical protein
MTAINDSIFKQLDSTAQDMVRGYAKIIIMKLIFNQNKSLKMLLISSILILLGLILLSFSGVFWNLIKVIIPTVFFIWLFMTVWRAVFHYFFPDYSDLD